MSTALPSQPRRLQRRRHEALPANTVFVGAKSPFNTMFPVGKTQIRMPALDGSAWEHEGRLDKPSGQEAAYVHPDSTVTWHQIETATAQQCVDLFAQYIGAQPLVGRNHRDPQWPAFQERVRTELAGKNLACTCAPDLSCHADVLLDIANSPRSSTQE